ncbi:tyrosine-type recombinase/integrase [Vibrio ziniensis]|uniref:Tyrosine-type recombinase/integrase n=1 Tax=Vibrio ziniensis TaxID=2711221 RepID=A0A6G7CQ51_9VIBR|nr:tyrosine-type recombinase/integrase [Vibrio ziniensis]QIH44209.1 tyrosine-type recombinase/integrase [Vibrio ziniensis]
MKKKLIFVTDQHILKQKVTDFNELISLEQMDDLTQHSYAHNSLLALKNDWNLFVSFCQSKSVKAIPASVTATRLFLEMESKKRKYSSIRRYSVTISLVHRLLSIKDPTDNPQVRQALMTLRLNKKGDEVQAISLTNAHLRALYSKYSKSKSVKVIRDLAIYHVMFECALKRSELKNLLFSQIETIGEHLILSFGQSQYQLSKNAVSCLGKWLTLVPRDSNYVFRSIDKHGNVANNILNDSSIFRILRNAGTLLGKPELKFSGQSARVGAVHKLSEQGYKIKEIQEFGRWLSPAMPYQYIGCKGTAEKEKLKFFSFKPWE